jgi:hypothetical protein
VLGETGKPRVLVVTTSGDLAREAFYVQHALTAAGADGPAFEVEGIGASQLSTWDATRLERYAVVLLLSTRGLDRRGRELMTERVRRGGGVLVAAGPTLDAAETVEAVGGAISLTPPAAAESTRTLAPSDARHPVFQTFGAGMAALGLVKFQRVAVVRGASCRTLAGFTTGEAALLECGVGPDAASEREARLLVFASDLGNQWNDFPLHATFVPFLQESIRYLIDNRHLPGEYLVGDAPQGVPRSPGFATVRATEPGGEARRVAVNVDPAESEGGRLTAAEFEAAVATLQDAPRSVERPQTDLQEDRQQIWRYVLGAMFAILALETLVAARTA